MNQIVYAVYYESIISGVIGQPGMAAIYFKEEPAIEYADKMNEIRHTSGKYMVRQIKISPIKAKTK